MPPSVLATKLLIPPLRRDWVMRPRLHRQLDHGIKSRLTLVSAPAGFGKTTLLVSWLHGRGGACAIKHRAAWISWEEDDNAPDRFLSYLIAALQTIDPAVGLAAHSYTETPATINWQHVMTLLINDLSGLREPSVLVLDDYHLIASEDLQKALAYFIEHLPPNLRLVIATREEPNLPLPRLRARGEVLEIRLGDLRLTGDETAEFFERTMALSLSPEVTQVLEDRTEGWVAGLQMAALSLRGRDAASTSDEADRLTDALRGQQRDIMDYLATEVLRQQPGLVRDFLRETAILDRFNASLCDAVTSRGESQKLLAHLEKANLFLVPLDDRRQWYRYHHLFADFLRSESNEADLQSLFRRASAWHEAHDLVPEAIKYSLAAEDYDSAVRLIRRGVEDATRHGQFHQTLAWINSLPNSVVRAHTDLLAHKGWLLYIQGDVVTGEAYAALAEENLSEDDTPAQRGLLLAFRADLAINRGKPALAVKYAQEALRQFGDSVSTFRTTALGHLGFAQRLCGERVQAIETLREAVTLARRLGHHHCTVESLGWLARMLHHQGHLREAIFLCEEAIREHSDARGNPLPMACQVYVPLGMLYYERNDLDKAREYLMTSMQLWRQMIYYPTMLAQRTLIKLYFAQGDSDAAWATLAEVRASAAKSGGLRRSRLVCGATAELQLRAGLAAAAALTLGDLPAAARQRSESENLLFVRLALAQGNTTEAHKLLQHLARPIEQEGRLGALITVCVLQSLALLADRDEPGAAAAMGRAISLAAPEGYRRSFLDEGPTVTSLVRKCRSVAPDFVMELLDANAPAAKKEAATEPTRESAAAGSGPHSPLSKTQLKVLRHVAQGLSNREIAAELAITEGTTKAHLNQIYGKLRVGSRTQAIARARQLRLI